MPTRPFSDNPQPTTLRDAPRWRSWWHRAKVAGLTAQRLATWQVDAPQFCVPRLADGAELLVLHGERRVALLRHNSGADAQLEAGKVRNVQLAAPGLHGLVLAPNQTLSFWRAVGRATAADGYVLGMELRGGCIRPAIAGGICLLSNALFSLACTLGWSIVERYGHTVQAVVPDPNQLWGLDATVFWPYVDLRVQPRQPSELRCVIVPAPVQGELDLLLQVWGPEPLAVSTQLWTTNDHAAQEGGDKVRRNQLHRMVRSRDTGHVLVHEVLAHNRKILRPEAEMGRNCLTCGEVSCHARVVPQAGQLVAAPVASAEAA
jgi:vancomycin resistance protein VanW